MRKLLFLGVLFLCARAYAQDYIVHVPDNLVEEGCKWNGYYKNSNDPGWVETDTKAQFFLDYCVFNPSIQWVLDTAIFSATWGKVHDFKSSGITVEVKNDGS